ncbi:MAG: peptidase T [Lactobacillus sp.]
MIAYNATYIQQKFIDYCRINTRSDERSEAVPTTLGQMVLLKTLETELHQLGLTAVSYSDADAYLVGKITSNLKDQTVAPLGFVAHVDTADYPADNVQPIVHPNYDGRDIHYPAAPDRVLSSNAFPALQALIGQTLITGSGDTLLGADDKAGIAGLLGMAKYLQANPQVPHGDVWLAFGPDEEIGRGAARLIASRFPVEFAYTLDNGQPGDIAYETFNAAAATVTFNGTVVHPGEAYGLMVNAALLASQFIQQLPAGLVPEKSRGYQGFIMVLSNEGNVDKAEVKLIVRSFDTAEYKAMKAHLRREVADLNAQYGAGHVSLTLQEQYRSPGDVIKQHPYVVNLVHQAYRQLGLKINHIPFRGGTDGDFITAKGIPTPNLFNGGGNFHGPYEYATTEQMVLLAKTLTAIVTQHVQSDRRRDETPLKR